MGTHKMELWVWTCYNQITPTLRTEMWRYVQKNLLQILVFFQFQMYVTFSREYFAIESKFIIKIEQRWIADF